MLTCHFFKWTNTIFTIYYTKVKVMVKSQIKFEQLSRTLKCLFYCVLSIPKTLKPIYSVNQDTKNKGRYSFKYSLEDDGIKYIFKRVGTPDTTRWWHLTDLVTHLSWTFIIEQYQLQHHSDWMNIFLQRTGDNPRTDPKYLINILLLRGD